jgi:HD-GYP domain-containing protein (c-di-GMP phosphodiesterase class II)
MPTRVLAFVTGVVASALAALVALYVSEPQVRVELIGGAVSFAVLGVVAHFVGYRLQGSTFGAISFIPFLTAIILYPAWPAVALILAAVTVSEFNRKKQAVKRLFNIAQQVLAASAAVYVYLLLGGTSLQLDESLRPIPEVGAVGAFLLVNTLAVAAVVAISEKKNLGRVWLQNVGGSIAYDVMAIPFIHAFALVFCHFQYMGVVFVLLLLFGVRQLYHTNTQLLKYNRELLEVLVHTVEMRDVYTSGHSQRVSRYSKIIARALGLPGRQVDRIGIAALLHDVGKIHEIFAPILSKPGKLSAEERAIMELHPIKSVELVEKVSELEDLLPAIRHHHENWDGTGYPDRLAGRDIPLGARIITFADTIDAMTTDRPYRKALGEEEVRSELIRMKGVQFDPQICDALLSSPEYALLFTGEESRGTPSITQIFDLARRKRTPAIV